MSKKAEIMKGILTAVAVTGVIFVALAIPNSLTVFKPFIKKKEFKRKQFRRSLDKLEKSNLVSIFQEGDKTVIRLTEKGKERILKYKLEDMRIQPQKKWDKKWRIVIFDVPIRHNAARLAFTRMLKQIGLKFVQKSVWISPFPLEEEIKFLKRLYDIEDYVRVLTVQEIDIAEDLRNYFKV